MEREGGREGGREEGKLMTDTILCPKLTSRGMPRLVQFTKPCSGSFRINLPI